MNKKLADYLVKSNQTTEEFSRKANVTRMTLYNIIKGKFKPSVKTIRGIIKASNGELDVKDLM